MTVATEFGLTFGCGHAGTIDLSGLAADRRGGRIAYLREKGLCSDCFDSTRARRHELERRSWVTARRKEADAEASAWARAADYPPLSGSPKQITFATRVRYELMRELYQWAVQEQRDPIGFHRVEPAARRIDTARWWLDQRALVTDAGSIGDLIELLDVAAATRVGEICENPA
jgi:ribosomal protein L37E